MATRIQVKLARAQLRAVLQRDTGRYVTRVTRQVLNRARVTAPVHTGTLRASQTMNVKASGSRVVGRVTTKIKYALPVHEGTKQYVIRPKRQRSRRNPNRPAMLRFVVGGRVFYRRYVNMPRRAGRPWLRNALYEVTVPQGFRTKPT